jgi:hypothetical protein
MKNNSLFKYLYNKERRQHPSFTSEEIRQIVRDHIKRGEYK